MLSGLYRVDTNKLTYQTGLLLVMRLDPFMTRFSSCRFRVDIDIPNPLRSNPNPKKLVLGSCRVRGLGRTLTPLTLGR